MTRHENTQDQEQPTMESVATIAKLRSQLRLQDAVIRSGATLTLTSAERDAIEGAIVYMETRGVWAWPATLRELLERTK